MLGKIPFYPRKSTRCVTTVVPVLTVGTFSTGCQNGEPCEEKIDLSSIFHRKVFRPHNQIDPGWEMCEWPWVKSSLSFFCFSTLSLIFSFFVTSVVLVIGGPNLYPWKKYKDRLPTPQYTEDDNVVMNVDQRYVLSTGGVWVVPLTGLLKRSIVSRDVTGWKIKLFRERRPWKYGSWSLKTHRNTKRSVCISTVIKEVVGGNRPCSRVEVVTWKCILYIY